MANEMEKRTSLSVSFFPREESWRMERRAWHPEATPAGDAWTTWGSWITAQGPPEAPPHTALTQAPCGTLGMQTLPHCLGDLLNTHALKRAPAAGSPGGLQMPGCLSPDVTCTPSQLAQTSLVRKLGKGTPSGKMQGTQLRHWCRLDFKPTSTFVFKTSPKTGCYLHSGETDPPCCRARTSKGPRRA